jgi:2-keto-4-pentenoate hydratase/2-oxohepta-3-ene-1,7-dioic acid hydratase in catechol pathway
MLSNASIRGEWHERFGRGDPKIICVGLNYDEHAGESGMALPTAPLLFPKFATALCGDGDPIVLPHGIGHVDAEAELAVVIGETARNVQVSDALSIVAGYTCANDVSARDVQFADGQWFRGKAYETFCPVGPHIVALDDPGNVRVTQRVNGEMLQDSTTRNLIFDIPTLIAYASVVLTLEPGDLILTGTPDGVGYFRDPKLSLRPGDEVEIEVEGIGVLHNVVQAL